VVRARVRRRNEAGWGHWSDKNEEGARLSSDPPRVDTPRVFQRNGTSVTLRWNEVFNSNLESNVYQLFSDKDYQN